MAKKRKPTMREYEQAAIKRLQEILDEHNDGQPFYLAPQILVEVDGREENWIIGHLPKMLGAETVGINYYRYPASDQQMSVDEFGQSYPTKHQLKEPCPACGSVRPHFFEGGYCVKVLKLRISELQASKGEIADWAEKRIQAVIRIVELLAAPSSWKIIQHRLLWAGFVSARDLAAQALGILKAASSEDLGLKKDASIEEILSVQQPEMNEEEK